MIIQANTCEWLQTQFIISLNWSWHVEFPLLHTLILQLVSLAHSPQVNVLMHPSHITPSEAQPFSFHPLHSSFFLSSSFFPLLLILCIFEALSQSLFSKRIGYFLLLSILILWFSSLQPRHLKSMNFNIQCLDSIIESVRFMISAPLKA